MVLGAIARFDAQSRDRTTQFFVQYSQDVTKLDAWGHYIKSGSIGININYPKLGDGNAVSLQYYFGVGTRHCRLRTIMFECNCQPSTVNRQQLTIN